MPLRIAAGIQTKILEAMASGLPVVATPRAVQGLSDEWRHWSRLARPPKRWPPKCSRCFASRSAPAVVDSKDVSA